MKTKKKIGIRDLTIVAVLAAISIVLSLTPLGFIPIGPIKATTMHIPVIVGGIVRGPLVGGLVGLLFGVTSMIQAVTRPTPFSFVFYNPIVAIVPRVLIGIVAHYVYKLLAEKLKLNQKFSLLTSASMASLTNTLGVLSLVYIFHGKKYVLQMGLNPDSAARVLMGVGLTNGIPEAIVASIIVMGVVGGLKYNLKK